MEDKAGSTRQSRNQAVAPAVLHRRAFLTWPGHSQITVGKKPNTLNSGVIIFILALDLSISAFPLPAFSTDHTKCGSATAHSEWACASLTKCWKNSIWAQPYSVAVAQLDPPPAHPLLEQIIQAGGRDTLSSAGESPGCWKSKNMFCLILHSPLHPQSTTVLTTGQQKQLPLRVQNLKTTVFLLSL